MGLGVGFAYASMANLIIEAVPQTQTGAASGINTIMRTIGGTLGGQIAASLIAAHLATTGLPKEAGFTAAFAMFAPEFACPAPGRSLALDGLLEVILANVLRLSHTAAESITSAAGRHRRVVARFR